MMTKQQVAEGRRLLLERYMELDPTVDAVILLSGGVDSTTILFAALECGFKPQCLTFHVKQWRSQDLAAAKKLSSWFRVPLEIVELPNTIDGVITDCYQMIDDCIDWWYVNSLKPTMFQEPVFENAIALVEKHDMTEVGAAPAESAQECARHACPGRRLAVGVPRARGGGAAARAAAGIARTRAPPCRHALRGARRRQAHQAAAHVRQRRGDRRCAGGRRRSRRGRRADPRVLAGAR